MIECGALSHHCKQKHCLRLPCGWYWNSFLIKMNFKRYKFLKEFSICANALDMCWRTRYALRGERGFISNLLPLGNISKFCETELYRFWIAKISSLPTANISTKKQSYEIFFVWLCGYCRGSFYIAPHTWSCPSRMNMVVIKGFWKNCINRGHFTKKA